MLQILVPAPLRGWSARRFWSVMYPASCLAAIGYFVAVAWPLRGEAWIAVAAVTAVWWVIWGVLAWVLSGFPLPGRS